MAKTPDKATIKAYYEDNGWKATISKYRIAPKDLSVLLGKSKAAKKKAPKKSKKAAKKAPAKKKPGRPKGSTNKKKAAPKKAAPKKNAKKAPKKKEAAKKKGKGGRRANPEKLINRISEDLEKLRGLIAA